MARLYSPSRPYIKREPAIYPDRCLDSVGEVFDKINQVWYNFDFRRGDEIDAYSLVTKKMQVTSDSYRLFPEGDGSQEASEDINDTNLSSPWGFQGEFKNFNKIDATYSELDPKTTKDPEVFEDPSAAVCPCSIAPVTVSTTTPSPQSPDPKSGTPLYDENILDLSMKRDQPVISGKLYIQCHLRLYWHTEQRQPTNWNVALHPDDNMTRFIALATQGLNDDEPRSEGGPVVVRLHDLEKVR
ncbi:hypothetical protein CHS0354_000854 [Potamilus streckersoni]|uniref:Uncharacterized protein n=1 Tax=Potamilus streckersoni TaxID=2493646 RepID=A0AAE0VK98_9BIVA|nr:hypothetical protein CHS0354_000854 [Potamilus streckersoni]